MNQQRSRRFRAAQEAQEKDEAKLENMKMMEGQFCLGISLALRLISSLHRTR